MRSELRVDVPEGAGEETTDFVGKCAVTGTHRVVVPFEDENKKPVRGTPQESFSSTVDWSRPTASSRWELFSCEVR